MAIATRHPVILWLTVALLVGQWGCAAKRYAPQAPPAQVTAQLRTIAMPWARYLPEADLKAPTGGKGMGAAQGAGRGAAGGALPGLGIAYVGAACIGAGREVGVMICGPVFALGLGVAAAGSAVGGLVGAVHGAVTAESASKIAAAESELKNALVESKVQETLRDRVLQVARDRSRLTFVRLDDPGPTAPGEDIDYRAWVGDGADTILEVSLRKLRFEGQGGVNPPVGLRVEARTRLIRASDGTELYAETVEYRGGSSTFTQWAADEARLFREELDRASVNLAESIVGLLGLPPTAPDTPTIPKPEVKPEPATLATVAPVPEKPEPSAAASGLQANVALPTPTPAPVPTISDSVALVGKWTGTLRAPGPPYFVPVNYPATLRVYQEHGRLRWSLEVQRGDHDGTGEVVRSEQGIALSGALGRRAVSISCSVTVAGSTLQAVGVGADNARYTLALQKQP